MPDMPSMDVAGITGFMSLILVALATFWGAHKAIYMAKN